MNNLINEKAKQIIDVYGEKAQMVKFIEELGELQTEIARKLLNDAGLQDRNCFGNLLEELADVLLMAKQIIIFYGMEELVDDIMLHKAMRTLERIKKEGK